MKKKKIKEPVYKTYDWYEYCFLKAQGYKRIVYARIEKS